jgi:DNA-binding transcriptional LysR family regulator
MERLDLNQMAILVEVVRGGSFTEASRSLGMPKSTVSKRIAELEDRLGTRLLQRTTRRLTLTPAGAEYFERCRRIMDDALAADRSVAERGSELRGTVRVTAPWLIADLVGQVTERFAMVHPRVSLELRIADERLDLVSQGIDLAVRAGALGDSSLVARRLCEVENRICASPDYMAGRKEISKPTDLSGHDCIGFKSPRSTWKLERKGKRVSVPVTSRYTVSSLALIRRAALAGLGLANLPDFFIEEELVAGRLVHLLPEWRAERGALQLLYPSRRNLSVTVRALADVLAEAFARHFAPGARGKRRFLPPTFSARAGGIAMSTGPACSVAGGAVAASARRRVPSP